MQWTADRVEQLTRLWAEGFSARKIAEKLGGGVTRNAVIGKAHRLHLQRGAETVEVVPVPEPPPIHVPILDPMPEVKSWMCRWPTEAPGKFGLHICGKTAQPGRPFCAEHLTQAYVLKKRSAA